MAKIYEKSMNDLHEKVKALYLDIYNTKDEKECESLNEARDDELESIATLSRTMAEELKKSQSNIESNSSINKRDIEQVDKSESEEEEPSNKK